jgi:hypothetical protein
MAASLPPRRICSLGFPSTYTIPPPPWKYKINKIIKNATKPLKNLINIIIVKYINKYLNK